MLREVLGEVRWGAGFLVLTMGSELLGAVTRPIALCGCSSLDRPSNLGPLDPVIPVLQDTEAQKGDTVSGCVGSHTDPTDSKTMVFPPPISTSRHPLEDRSLRERPLTALTSLSLP